MAEQRATFDGVAYVRPVRRGIVLMPSGTVETPDAIDLDDWLETHLGYIGAGGRSICLTISVCLSPEATS